MNIKDYLRDKIGVIIIFVLTFIMMMFIFMAFRVHHFVMISILSLFAFSTLCIIVIDYFRKRSFYNALLLNIQRMDQAYLVLETLDHPTFYEGELLYSAMYDINKSMVEMLNEYKRSVHAFKDYVEMWIHEVKIPLATLNLTINNHDSPINPKIKTQLKRLEDHVEQVLYYVRSEHAEKDYFIKAVDLNTIVKNVSLKNMDDLLEHQIDYTVSINNNLVYTDPKWLEFILGQLVNNAIKYRRGNIQSTLSISTQTKDQKTMLIIEDNGLGISPADLKQVFNKSFTGVNGHQHSQSTGMGLYIAKQMCHKLGHEIRIESIVNDYTRLIISFGDNSYYLS